MKADFLSTFEQGFSKFREEVEQYADDETFWAVPGGVTNSAGTLSLHLIGNLNHYIGAKLGGTGYVRNRPVEFSSRDVPRSEILQKIDQAASTISDTINKLSEEDLSSEYHGDEGDKPVTVSAELLKILTHFHYHLGQINYHRRIVSQRP